MTRAHFAQRVDDYYSVAITNLLAQGVELRLRGVSGACEDALEHRDALFSFARVPGVDPTNNHAERALRPSSSGERLLRARRASAAVSLPRAS
jgi:hypothetical protein